MLIMIAVGCLLIVFSTIVHSGFTYLTIKGLHRLEARGLNNLSIWTKTWSVSALVIGLFIAALIEVGGWAVTFRIFSLVDDAETAFYFSAVTFTTLGYGDVVLEAPARILASFEAINGILIFGWSTALLVAFITRLAPALRADD